MQKTQTEAPIEKKSVRLYTVGEEIFNSISHGVGALLAIIGGTVVVTLAAVFCPPYAIAASLIYALTLFVMYTMSTLYHAFPFPKVKHIFRIFDHSSVFLLIAGSYTPFMLIALRGQTIGLVIFALVWFSAIVGIVLNAISLKRFAKLSLVLYVVMGWSIVAAFGPIAAVLPAAAIWLLALGGVSYTGGIFFYVAKKKPYAHAIWHLFVLMGSILHYICVVMYVLPLAKV